MFGAIIGDIVGSRYEFHNHLSKDFDLFATSCTYTDDTVMTCAVADLFLQHNPETVTQKEAIEMLREYGKIYPGAGYGNRFYTWLFSANPKPYNSCGNGSAMRISPVGWVAKTEQQAKELSEIVTAITHDHPEGIKGAECTTVCIFLARTGMSKEKILAKAKTYYTLDKTCDQIREETRGHHGKEICQVTMPQALQCFAEGESFENVIRNCVSIGGDTDTIGAIAGAIAEAYYGISDDILQTALRYLPIPLRNVATEFSKKYC